jgi:hypothetical protein
MFKTGEFTRCDTVQKTSRQADRSVLVYWQAPSEVTEDFDPSAYRPGLKIMERENVAMNVPRLDVVAQ